MNKKVTVDLSTDGIEKMIKALEDYQKWLEEGAKKLLSMLVNEGHSVASAQFRDAVYDGTNDVQVLPPENRGENYTAIVAVGEAALFIEFGTGVAYPDEHPEAATNGFERGGFGKHHGLQNTWGYYGDPGTNGVERTNRSGNTVVLTHGNPANMPMYQAVRTLETRLGEMAREAFA